MTMIKSARADINVSTGAPTTEIEITPEMLEAGVRELVCFNEAFEFPGIESFAGFTRQWHWWLRGAIGKVNFDWRVFV